MIFGEWGVTNRLKFNFENWNALFKWIDDIVKKSMEEHAKKANKEEDP